MALAQIATTTSIGPQLPAEPLIAFERKLTDEYAVLIHAKSMGVWDELCKQYETGGIHADVGRSLAFNYATARNYLFELQTPGLFQTWRDGKRIELTRHLGEDLSEATELAAAVKTNCFIGAPFFDDNRQQWKGQFQLNVAQLLIDRLPTVAASEQEAERSNIRRMLDGARDLLGPTPSDDGKSAVERLLSPPPFESQRQRVTFLQSLLNNSQE